MAVTGHFGAGMVKPMKLIKKYSATLFRKLRLRSKPALTQASGPNEILVNNGWLSAGVQQRLLRRARWEYYRVVGIIGLAGVLSCAAVLIAITVNQFFIVPSLERQKSELVHITGKLKAIHAMHEIATQGNPITQKLSGHAQNRDVLELANKIGLSTDEVNYLQIQKRKSTNKNTGKAAVMTAPARTLITLPTAGYYPQFRAMVGGLAALQEAQITSFSLTRKTPEETELAIEMKISVPTREAL